MRKRGSGGNKRRICGIRCRRAERSPKLSDENNRDTIVNTIAAGREGGMWVGRYTGSEFHLMGAEKNLFPRKQCVITQVNTNRTR